MYSRVIAVQISCIAFGLGLGACTSDTSSTPAPAPAPAPAAEPATVLIRGKLTGDAATSKKTHDGLAAGGKAKANALGDVGHYTFVGAQDAQQFLSIDRWTSLEGLKRFFSDKDIAAGFAAV